MQGSIAFDGTLSGSIAGGGGGGSEVTITPVLTEGTKIADYDIDGTPGELYAPDPEALPGTIVTKVLREYNDTTQTKIAKVTTLDTSNNQEVSQDLYAPSPVQCWYTPGLEQDYQIGQFTYGGVTQNVYIPYFQRPLTAGANITIDVDNVISASGGESIITETNSNGTYIWFTVSKVLICYKTVTENVTYSAWGSLYESSIVNLGNFAHEFKAGTVPIVNINLNNSSSSALNGAIANITNTSAGTVRAIRPNNPGATSITFGLVAYGVYE